MNDRGTGTVETAEGLFTVPARSIAEAMNGDTVQVRPLPAQGKGGTPAAAVTHVLDRAVTTFAARYVEDGQLRVLIPLDDRLCHDFVLPGEDTSVVRLHVADGDMVCARIARYPSRREAGQAVVERVIGSSEDVQVAIEAVIASHDLAVAFPPAALEQASSLELDLASALVEPHRRDIRDRFLVTVDPDDARDFDDAVSIEPAPQGGWVLGVHIADVSSYVEEGSPIDLEARRRATSVYLADRVLPMLPEALSCDLCSLRPGQDRLAMTVDLVLDAQGRVLSTDCYPSIVRSRARMRYGEVDDLLAAAARGDDEAAALWVDGVSLGAFFTELDRVRVLRQGLRRERGAIEFVTTEAKAVLDAEGRPVAIEVRRRTPATMLVEEAMLAANEAVARRLEAHGAPTAFRVHEPPAADALAVLVPRLRELGCAEDARVRAGLASGDARAVQRILDEVAGQPTEELVSSWLLRAMRRAVYGPANEGHYGLGAAAYCHFTSPIRRYPDLMAHRALKAALGCGARHSQTRASAAEVSSLCAHASKMERVAAAAGYESQAVMAAELLRERVGERFSGVVSGAQPFGVFVRLDETATEGMLHVRDLGGGWWEFDDAHMELRRESDGRTLRPGQRVVVCVRSCDVFRGRVDLSLP